jgi:Tol biopolymer transport system component
MEGAQGNGSSSNVVASADAQTVAFQSVASNFVAGDENEDVDVFIRNLTVSSTSVISKAKFASRTAPGSSETGHDHALSSSGRFVAFVSGASILVPHDETATSDVFVRDDRLDSTMLVTRDSSGSQANSGSFDPAVSANGRFVAYQSFADNLVSGDTNDTFDVFVHDRSMLTTSRASVSGTGEQGNATSANPSISADGRVVAFVSSSDNLAANDPDPFSPDVFVRSPQTGTTARLTKGGLGALDPSVSADGRFVAFVESSNVFVFDRWTGTRSLVSVGLGGAPANSFSGVPSISADGRYVAFYSGATNLVAGDEQDELTSVFVRDRFLGATTRVSESSIGIPADSDCFEPAISGNGRYIAFYSDASNLVSGDTNNTFDVFVHDRVTGTTTRESMSSNGDQSDGDSFLPSLSQDGRKVAFTSLGTNLVANDFNSSADVFVHERRDVPVFRINAGGAGVTDSKGRFWQADRNFSTGAASSFAAPIANTTDDVLYQNERWDPSEGPELQYTIPVPNGVYWVRLHFAENYSRNFAAGKRVFDVYMEGVQQFDNIDIFREVGARAALIKTASIAVTDGQLNLLFRHQIQNPIVDAIEIVQQ